LRARVVARGPPVQGTGFQCPTAGDQEIRAVQINLDEPNPIGRVSKQGRQRPVSFTVSGDETEVFDITAVTRRCHCRWVVEMVTVQDGEERLVTVRDGDEPFATTPLPGDSVHPFGRGRPYYSWDWSTRRWIAYPNGFDGESKTFAPSRAPLPELRTSG
jgi:hypothetical protein